MVFILLPLFHCPAQVESTRVHSSHLLASVVLACRACSREAGAGLVLTRSADQQALASPGFTRQPPMSLSHCHTPKASSELAGRSSIEPRDSCLLAEKSSSKLFKTKQQGQGRRPQQLTNFQILRHHQASEAVVL